ncbi:MAG: Yop proteins translocation protein K [Alphaproteobacteria bacterium]|nr:Yop proteins translocation protein K [Alphaproteobacteria bacterium]
MTAERQGRASARPRSYRRKLRFERLPAAYCHPGRIAALLPEGLPTSFQGRLQGSRRLCLRLSAVLTKRFALLPLMADDLATPEGHFAQLEGQELANAISRIGAIWHAQKIRKLILAEPLRRLIERLGPDNYRAALRFIDLAPEDEDARDGDHAEGGAPDVDLLLGRIERDALIAVSAWRRHQPPALAERLRLKLPPCPEVDDDPPASHADRGLIIVDRVVTTLAAEAGEAVSGHD